MRSRFLLPLLLAAACCAALVMIQRREERIRTQGHSVKARIGTVEPHKLPGLMRVSYSFLTVPALRAVSGTTTVPVYVARQAQRDGVLPLYYDSNDPEDIVVGETSLAPRALASVAAANLILLSLFVVRALRRITTPPMIDGVSQGFLD